MSDERAKPLILVLVLAFIVGSYFRSEVYKRGGMASFGVHFHEDSVCQERAPEEREDCRASLARALVPVRLSCMPSFRDLFVCENPTGGNTNKNPKTTCPSERKGMVECLKTHLRPYGFSENEIVRLVLGKQRPPPQEQPSLEVAGEGGGGAAGGQGEKPSETNEAVGQKKEAGEEEANRASAAHGEGVKPNVEVETESGQGGDGER